MFVSQYEQIVRHVMIIYSNILKIERIKIEI
jgi:hypothetical protein